MTFVFCDLQISCDFVLGDLQRSSHLSCENCKIQYLLTFFKAPHNFINLKSDMSRL